MNVRNPVMKLALSLLVVLLAVSCWGPRKPKDPCAPGLAPLNATLKRHSGGGVTADLTSQSQTIYGLPVKVSAEYKWTKDKILQCISAPLLDAIMKQPNHYDIEVDKDGWLTITPRKDK